MATSVYLASAEGPPGNDGPAPGTPDPPVPPSGRGGTAPPTDRSDRPAARIAGHNTGE